MLAEIRIDRIRTIGGQMNKKGLLAIFCIIILASGCSQKNSNVFYVMFKKRPVLSSNSVYLNNLEIGKILSQKYGFNNIVEIKITIDHAHIKKMRENTVFFVSNGRLEYDTLKGTGDVLANEAFVLGFHSKGSQSWFKLKNTFKNLSIEASKNANELHEIIRWVELKEIT